LLKVGCLSWTYPDWKGSFYDKSASPSDFLRLYSRVFDIVEVDSTFYRTPSENTVRQWRDSTPKNFTFTVKVPKTISHSARGKDTSKEFAYFQKTMSNLGEKLGCVVVQMPPHFKFETGLDRLKEFISQIEPGVRCAVELRNQSWYNEETYRLFRDRGICLVWAVNEFVEDFLPVATTDFVYLRFRGEFNEFKKFDRIQREKTEVLRKWWDRLNPLIEGKEIQNAFTLVSNHFEGFAPATANRFRELAGLRPVEWKQNLGKSANDIESLQAY
jgi:uncharacterized protein YecE (DUF72 family)